VQGGFVASAFLSNGVTYEVSRVDRSAIYLEFLPLVNSNTVLLLDVPEMLRELRGLERRRGASGRDRVDHRPGSFDDLANAAAGALVLAARTPTSFACPVIVRAADIPPWLDGGPGVDPCVVGDGEPFMPNWSGE